MSQSKLSISVAMCTYNGSRFLPEQLASIARQTRQPDEMVVSDDGSTDATAEIVENFARSAPFPVRFIRNPRNLGSTKNFEQAIGLCSCDLIALSDQDDIWMPDKLARQAEMFELDPSLGGVFTDAELIDETGTLLCQRLWFSIYFSPSEQQKFQRQ
jgi:glycosyltransferase involved in cell wall biosynthesis